ncbi:MAG: T9SS type A sorting domain-containing protein [Chitinophagaceae bacterium]|nr:T9SS type A sorting domain-containing protein [Chitinophagaceae bacterium]
MRYLLLSICSALFWLQGQSQLSVGPTDQLVIQSGTTFFVDSLVLIPSSNTTITNTDLTKSYTSVTGPGGALSIMRVYSFSNPLPAYNGTAGIIYSPTELAGNPEASLRIAYRTGPTWTTTASSSVDLVQHFVSYTASGQIYNQITATQAGAVLPVTFTNFTATLQSQHVQLNWGMGDIDGLQNFDIQYSDNGRNWSSAGIVNAPANTREFSYQHNDLNFTSRVYRIMASEVSGVHTYSKLAVVRKGEATTSMSIIRKDNGAVLFFNGAVPGMIQVYDVNGRLLMSRNVQQQQVEINGVSTGAYIIHYMIDGKKMSKMIQL